jgi:hypothetical protein
MKLKQHFSSTLIASLIVSQAYAQITPAPTPFVDPHPYQSQTWWRTKGGNIKTLSGLPGKDAFMFDHPNALPAITSSGSNYGVFKVGKGWVVAVVDAKGQLFQYDLPVAPGAVGGTFYTRAGSHELVVVDSDGAAMETTMKHPDIALAGGNYFFDSHGTLYTVRSMGAAKWNWAGMVTSKQGLIYPKPLALGGNFYLDAQGRITTISSKTGFFSDPFQLDKNVFALGGNYFVTGSKKADDLELFTVNHEGAIQSAGKLARRPLHYGYSYFIFEDGKFGVIQGDGNLLMSAQSVDRSGKKELVNKFDSSSWTALPQKQYQGER